MEKIMLFKDKTDCCGCGACMNICAKQAISMREDEYGFLYPVINETLCIRCGACKKVCGYQNVEESNTPLETFVGVTKKTDVMQSASGGIFASIATSVIEENGIVYGCSMELIDGVLSPIHIGVDNLVDLKKLQGSKYVQSFIGNSYSQVKQHLNSQRIVLFSGTPCQIAGLKAYLNKDYDNLLLIDIICHGVPNAKLFKDYIYSLEKKLKAKITEFNFRDKTYGWGYTGKAIYKTANGKVKEKLIYTGESSYCQLFLKSEICRESCYVCKYANSHRTGDVTIGDYWGVEKEHPVLLSSNGGSYDEKKGISCLIVNTEQGRRFIDRYASDMQLSVSKFECAARKNGQLKAPIRRSEKRYNLLELYREKGYDAVEMWFKKDKGFKLILIKIKNRLPYKMKIKSMLGR
ncbi:Coenzyme F420 hydrogenase/dehydrogenase, beta subunit C-terminal domain [Acetivibrio cellulolyticus]|uniref:Coenzyme F420 hydrogenase/dehydrogenase, beta subunit C-terminal domain n=1 Tax=Acetivibrio cellulolyticus TaxID=35830 RepID=UPI0001E2CBDC|nr:Coenzyme F420 hydrogenase/dehydrogenase, beta subunit C-terminal domain [Acetivibrio cellulolyticus]